MRANKVTAHTNAKVSQTVSTAASAGTLEGHTSYCSACPFTTSSSLSATFAIQATSAHIAYMVRTKK